MTQKLQRTPHRSPYLAALEQRVLIFDGAMGTNIQRHALTAADFGGAATEGCNDYLVMTRPDVIRGIHESFLAVGCDVVETCTFQSTPRRLAEWGLKDITHELNVRAARLARDACARYATPDRPRFVAGSIGPTGMLPSSDDPVLSAISFDELSENFYQQARALVEGGVDVLLVETSQDILEVKAALAGFERLFAELGHRVPVQAQVTLDTSGRMLLGTDIASAMTTLDALGADVIGLNCSTGPEHMREPVRFLSAHARRPVSCIPNAGLPINTGEGEAVYPLEPAPMAAALAEFVRDFGVRVVGGCCGTTPAHLAAVVEAVRQVEETSSAAGTRSDGVGTAHRRATAHAPRVSSAMRAITLHQDPPPLLVGERVNAQGSRRVKRLLLDEDYDGIVEVAREQVDSGAHVLDVCVALTERSDEAEQMARVAKLLSMSVEAPLMIDSTEPAVIARALEHVPGRAIVNSINMENGRERMAAVLPLVKRHGAAVVALTIDEQGMAKTCERKLEVARRIHDIAVREYGLAPEDLIFDALTFTLATGEREWVDSAHETIEGIRAIKRELPGVFTILGVSNVSFGLTPTARAVLNSVFLHHCVQAGLDLAIVNPAHVRPYGELADRERALADDLVFNRHPDALQRFIEGVGVSAGSAAGADESAVDATAGMTAEERIHWQIVHRKKEGIEELLDAAGVRTEPVRLLNDVLLPAMKEVGDRFGAGELILPFVLQSAEVMKRAVRHLEQFLERTEGHTKGTVVLATVYGDVHDIGKSLVNTILSNNGYTVHDLGKQVPVNTIIDRAVEVGADAIGLSALLVSTSKQMPICVQELDRRGLSVPVLIGGAAINRRFGRRALFVDGERPYAPGVFYCKDAFEGLETIEALVDDARRAALTERVLHEAREDVFLRSAVGKDMAAGAEAGDSVRSAVASDNPVPVPPFWGTRVLRDIPLDDVLELLDLDELFRLQWGARGSGAQYEATVQSEFRPVLERLCASAKRDGWLAPRAVYGYFPVQSSGNALVVYDPAAYSSDGGSLREIARFVFPRQAGREHLCLADYFRSVESEEVDVAAFQIVTVGDEATRRFDALQQRGEYSEAYYLHGLGVEAAEAVAEWMHRRVRRELGVPLAQGGGKRYSWGYPACPELDGHATLFRLLPAAEALGMEFSAAYQLIPEQSTAALVVHHPAAKYFAVRDGAPRAAAVDGRDDVARANTGAAVDATEPAVQQKAARVGGRTG
ncbi:MAG TPA: methionine synthase [Gemmatimonadaceae bacterium]|nr:methionine synthase [Gemmatimonadaceae bacterium]